MAALQVEPVGQPGGMRSPGPGGAGPQREMNAPRAPQSERGPRVDRPGRGAEGPPRGIERNRQAEPQQPNRQRERATEREQNRAAGEQRSEQRRNAERERNAERARSAEQERSRAGQPNNVVTRNASAMPSVPARPSASALAVIRNGLRTGSGSGQNSPIDATGRPGTASKVGIASRSGARKCAGRETG